jgi:hypothetical protein
MAGAGAVHQIGGIAHALLAAGDNDLGVAAADRLHRLLHRFQPGAAHQIDGDRRVSDRQAGPQAVWRAGFCPQPAVSTWPKISSSTAAAGSWQVQQAAHDPAPRSTAESGEKAPRKLPIGVRTAATITNSVMFLLS